MNNKKIIDAYLLELKEAGFSYISTELSKNKSGSFDVNGLGVYDDMPNVKNIFLLEGEFRNETKNDIKFLLVEVYEQPTPDGKYFGVPSFSYIHDVSDGSFVSTYMLDDDDVSVFDNIVDATSFAIKKFETDNYQRIMLNDYVEENVIDIAEGEEVNREIASLSIAKAVIVSFNNINLKLFDATLDFDTPKLMVSCKKYDTWTDIIDTGVKGNVHEQIENFIGDNYLRCMNEAIDISKVYTLSDLKNSNIKKQKIKP